MEKWFKDNNKDPKAFTWPRKRPQSQSNRTFMGCDITTPHLYPTRPGRWLGHKSATKVKPKHLNCALVTG